MRNEKAFTLVEMMFVVVLIAIVASIAVQNFREASLNNEIKSVAFTLGTALGYAKDEAIMRRSFVTLCPSANVNDANATCTSGGDWADGYIVFLDLDNNGVRADAETLLRVFPSMSRDQVTVRNLPDAVTFLPTGFRSGGSSVIEARIGIATESGEATVVDTSKFHFQLNIAENGTFKILVK
ncbi:GspH/FimT family pseudopilin [Desulfococcaceae bacterium OttesenSCG-928-F15]|nr:GspH/FimT family pseudopilin [Desulfococcaceae bacterium OttesenSCG-928-F15]